MRITRIPMAALGVALTLVLTACGDDATEVAAPAAPSSSAAAPSSVNGVAAEHNDADVTFINGMTPHHSGAVAMAELAAERASNPQVKELAARIEAAQAPELEQMQAMAGAWGVTIADAGGEHGGGHMGAMGMDDAAALEPLSGPAFDEEFLTRMVAHHEGALPMARTELESGANRQAKTMAQNIIDSQTLEITEMNNLLRA